MAQGPEVVIVDSLGTEHVFPPGFDPQRAAKIVKAQSDEMRAQAPSVSGEQYPSASMTGGVVSGMLGEAKNQGLAILDAIKAGVEHAKTGTLPEGPGREALTAAIMAPVHAVQRMGAGTPEDLGAGMLQTAENAPVVLGAGKGVASGVRRIPALARALPESTAPIISGLGIAHGIYSGNPTEVLASAAGEGTLHKLINRVKKIGAPKENPNAGGRMVPSQGPAPTQQQQLIDMLRATSTPEPAPELLPSHPTGGGFTVPPSGTTTPEQAVAASHAQRMAKLEALPAHLKATGTDTNFGRLPNAGNALYRQEGIPSELEQQLMDRQAREADALTNMPRHMRDANVDVVSGASGIGNELSPASTAAHVPQAKGGPVSDILETLQNHAETMRNIPSSKTKPAWYEPSTAVHIGKMGNLELYNVIGGASDGLTVSAETLEKLGIEVPKKAPAMLASHHEITPTKVPMGESGPLHAPGVKPFGTRMTPARADLRSQMMDRLMQHYNENTPY